MLGDAAVANPDSRDTLEVRVTLPASEQPSRTTTPSIGSARPAGPGPQGSSAHGAVDAARGDHTALGVIRLTPSERAFLDSALTDMTQRERDVVYALCAGGTNEEMARRLEIALPTLRTHLMRLNQKLRTSSKSDVIRHIASVLLEGYRTDQIHADRF